MFTTAKQKYCIFFGGTNYKNSYCPRMEISISFPHLLIPLTFVPLILFVSNLVYSASLTRLNSTYASKSSWKHPPTTPLYRVSLYKAHTTDSTNVTFFPFFFSWVPVSSLCLHLLLPVRKKHAVFPTVLSNEQWTVIGYLIKYISYFNKKCYK